MLRLFEHGKLFVPQSEVGSACIVELAVRTGFRHFPLINHYDVVGTSHCGQAVGDDDDRLAFPGQCIQCFFYVTFGYGIQ